MEPVALTITEVAFGGKGVGRNAGKVIFVPFTIDGERVSVRVVREKKHFAEAELVELIESSPDRVVPHCPYFGQCGGCSYQHIKYEHQLQSKTEQVEQAMRRIGRITDPPIGKIVPSPLQYGYRNRISVHAKDNVVGFYRRDPHQLMDIESCRIAAPEVNQALARLRATTVRDGHYGLRAHPDSRVFEQTNDVVAGTLAASIEDMLSGERELLIDAFCGAGFFSKRLAPRFKRVIGIDWDRFAIEAARKGAEPKETYLVGDVALELGLLLANNDPTLTTLIIDPPAAGLPAEARRAILHAPPCTVIYVSCNPSTLARDVAELRRQFEITSITPFDMFPQTAEIEVLVQLLRRPI